MSVTSKKDAVIRVRVAADQKHALFEAARRRGATLSDFVRETAADAARQVAA